MRELLRDELDQFLVELSLNCHDGLYLNAEQVVEFAKGVGSWRDLARQMSEQISQLTWNLRASEDALKLVNTDLVRAEAMLRNNDVLNNISNQIIDEVDRTGSNVCLMVRPVHIGADPGEEYPCGDGNNGGAA